MPLLFLQYLQGHNIYVCKQCRNHLTALSELVSTHYRSQRGDAYLFHKAVNVKRGEPYRKSMTSGMFLIRDLYCLGCDSPDAVGWIYIKADSPSQQFKEGLVILSMSLLGKESWNQD